MKKLFDRLRAWAQALKREAAALYLAYKRKDTPFYAKAAILLAVAYALSPLDLIPDFIPVLGYLDDLILVPLLIRLALRLVPPQILAETRAEAELRWHGRKPAKWYYALPVAIIWLLIAAAVVIRLRP
jgi:uncharacterized membrane protein YkvA (DUF1232 family)